MTGKEALRDLGALVAFLVVITTTCVLLGKFQDSDISDEEVRCGLVEWFRPSG